jgi:hypothetical protein
MTSFSEFNSPQDRVYTMVNRQALSTWLQTWTNQPTAVSTVRSLQAVTEQTQSILTLNPKEPKRTR